MAAQTARRAHAELERAARLAASLEERERLSRQVHDGAIQVLALVSRRGREIGGETAELAELAGEQERALRRLVSSAGCRAAGRRADRRRRAAAPTGIRPGVGERARRPGAAGRRRSPTELCGGRGNALDNVAAHAGPDARAYVLLEDLGDSVTVSIRDDGVGHRGRPARGSGRRGSCRSCEIDCGTDELAGWQREAEHRAGMWDGMGADGTPTVMVVDDHPIWRDAVARDLAEDGFAVVATADGVASARRRAAVVHPDVVVMDMRLSDGDGAQATAEVLAVSPASRILVLSASDERDDVLEAVKAGATGYLVKSASKHELGDAVRATAEGRAVFTPGLAGLVLGEYRRIAQPVGPALPGLGAEPDRTRNRDTAPRREGLDGQADRRPAVAESPHGREPRAGDVPQASGRQPGRVGALRDRTRPGQGVVE